MFKFPVKIPETSKVYVTQVYGNPDTTGFYKANGVDIDKHNGVDFVITPDNLQTYGTPIICPFPEAVCTTSYVEGGTAGRKVSLQYNGYYIVFLHLSAFEKEGMVKGGDCIGYLGNTGLVTPKPSPIAPYAGSHGHITAFKLVNGAWEMIDPLEILDKNDTFIGESGIEKDAPAIQLSFDKLGITDNWEKIKFILNLFKIK